MSSETPPEKKSDSAANKSDNPVEQLNNLNQLTKALESILEQLARLIVTKNWVSLLLLIDAGLFLFLNPVVLNKFLSTFNLELSEQYPVFFWALVGGIFLTALVIAIRTIARKPPPPPDFTERKAIKGLRAFSREDAEIFAQLQRERDLRECLESITSKTFRFGILMGESGTGKTSFLQAGIIPQLDKSASNYQGIYIRFSNQDPIATIYKALKEELQNPAIAINDRDLIGILSWAVDTAEKPLILIFDQFEQFFVHYKQKVDREPFINALKSWYCDENPLPVKILISIRGDLADKLIELQKALGYSLSPQEVFRLERFSPEEATRILQVIAQAEAIKFDEKFVQKLTRDELASNEDGLISPVDLQVLAWTIERQDNQELRAFNRTAFQKIGGIEGLMTRFLNKTLDARVIASQRQAAIKVLLAMTDLERNVRAGMLNLEDLQNKTQGTLAPGEIVEATTWLASSGVRLITPVDRDGNDGYELAHERIIPALREVAGKELTSADRANQLLDRRVNEWLGNQRSSRYLLNWRELRLFQQQKPYLVWGANRSNKERLLQRSWRKLYQQLVVVAMALVFCLLGIVWWHQQLVAVAMALVFCLLGIVWWNSPWGQIQQVKWELARLSKRVNDEYRRKIALAFVRGKNLEQALTITNSIENSLDKALVLIAVAQTYGKLKNFEQVDQYLGQTFSAVQQIEDSYNQATVLVAIVKTIGKLENCNLAGKYLGHSLVAAMLTNDSLSMTKVFAAIAETIGKLENFEQIDQYLRQTFSAAQQIEDSYNKALVLIAIAQTYGKLENFEQANKYLGLAITIAEAITVLVMKVEVLIAIAQTHGKLENFEQADKYLRQTFSAAQQALISSDKAMFLIDIAQTYGKLENFKQVDQYLGLALSVAKQIHDSDEKAFALIAIADTYCKLENFKRVDQYLRQAITVAKQIDYSYDKAKVLITIAQTYCKLENFERVDQYLGQAITTAETITNSHFKAMVLTAISQTQAKLDRWRQAHNTVYECPTDECKVESLAHILTAWAEKKNPALK